MPAKRKKKRKEELYTQIAIKVLDYEVRSSASVNIDLKLDRPVFSRPDDLAYQFVTELTIRGACMEPIDRQDHLFDITILGRELHAGQFSTTLSDYQVCDDHGVRQYREYRGETIPVYQGPSGIATLDKVRGEDAWTSWLFVKPRLVSDMLVQLTQISPVYVSMTEHKKDRMRRITDFSLQTTNPLEE